MGNPADGGSGFSESPSPFISTEERLKQLYVIRKQLEEDMVQGAAAFAAFEALVAIGRAEMERSFDRPEPPDSDSRVEVPLWIVANLAKGWLRYRKKEGTDKRGTLGKAFGLEAKGRGPRRTLTKSRLFKRDLELAYPVHQQRIQGETLEDAIAHVAGASGEAENKALEAKIERAYANCRKLLIEVFPLQPTPPPTAT